MDRVFLLSGHLGPHFFWFVWVVPRLQGRICGWAGDFTVVEFAIDVAVVTVDVYLLRARSR